MKPGLKSFAASTLAVGMLSLGSASAANLVSNPSFDLDTPPGGTAPLDWTLTNAASGSDFFVGVESPGPLSPPNSANFGATGTDDDILTQTLATTAGDQYTITFFLAHNETDTENDFSAWFGSDELLSLTNTASFGYTLESFVATATSSSTVLTFRGREVPAWYLLDNVQVAEGTPEPSTWAMMILGFAGLGYFGWRRAKVRAA